MASSQWSTHTHHRTDYHFTTITTDLSPSLSLNPDPKEKVERERHRFWSYKRPQTSKRRGCSKKRDLGAFKGHLSFWVIGVELPLIFYTKKRKEKKKENTKPMIKILHCHWLNKDKYNLGKLNLTRLWVLVTIYVKEYKAFVPSYNLQKNKNTTFVPVCLSSISF